MHLSICEIRKILRKTSAKSYVTKYTDAFT